MHEYMFHQKDFYHGTRHLSKLQRWIYRDMLDMYYDREEGFKVESVDDIFEDLQLETEQERAAFDRVLRKMFIVVDGVYVQTKAQINVDHFQNQHASKSKAGKASAEARRKKKELQNKALEQNANSGEQESGSVDNHKPLTSNHEPVKLDQSAIDQLFEKFWNEGTRPANTNTGGLKRVGKKPALLKFRAIIKALPKETDPEVFTQHIINDIKQKFENNELGVDNLHPKTYLHNERWTDEHYENTQQGIGERTSPIEQVNQEARAALAAAIGQSEGNNDMGEDD